MEPSRRSPRTCSTRSLVANRGGHLGIDWVLPTRLQIMKKNIEKATNEDLALTTWFVIKHLQSYNHHEEVGLRVEVEERLNKIEQP